MVAAIEHSVDNMCRYEAWKGSDGGVGATGDAQWRRRQRMNRRETMQRRRDGEEERREIILRRRDDGGLGISFRRN